MSIIIFCPSKNRAAQLRLLLQSIRDNLPTNEIASIIIGYKYTTEDFKKGYEKLQAEKIIPNISWRYEDIPTEKFIDGICNVQTEYVLLMPDDSFIYRHIPTLWPAIDILNEHQNVLTFTLRLGFNTKYVDYVNLEKPASEIEGLLQPHKCIDKTKRNHAEGVYTWNWKTTRIHHFSHPISLDGTIIRMSDLKMLTLDAEHNNYRQWECCISEYVKRFDKNLHACFEHSSLVTIPINQVVDAGKLTDGVFHGISPEALNGNYLMDNVVDYHRLLRECEYDVDTPQKEFAFWFRRKRWYDKWLGK